MNYFIQEVFLNNKNKKNAGSKAREDIETILLSENYKPIVIQTMRNNDTNGKKFVNKVLMHINIEKEFRYKLCSLNENDVVVIQFPMINHSIFLSHLFKKLIRKKVNLIILVHDLECLRFKSNLKGKVRIWIEELSLLRGVSKVIVHNEEMIKALKVFGVKSEKMVDLEIFDYLIPNFNENFKIKQTAPIIIAGNLKKEKAGYIYKLPEDMNINLYGNGFEGENTKDLHYQGAFLPSELPEKIQGAYGLVWDGESSDTCEGMYGAYLKINNPHKTSLYLAVGIPVIIWKQAALSKYIIENECGIAVDSLKKINEVLENITLDEYLHMKKNAMLIGQQLRSGSKFKKALEKCYNDL